MEHEFWHERWKNQELGFHRSDVHPLLQEHMHALAKPGATVFVPLCGKSLDMQWLREQGYQVLGIELNASAIAAFFSEHELQPSIHQEGPLTVYRAPGITIYQGDFFKLTAAHLHGANAWYDRAAMVALPQAMRAQYVAHLQQIMPSQAVGFVVAVEYPKNYWKGPPFALFADDIAHAYSARYHIAEQPLVAGFVLGGDPAVTERGYVLTPS